MRHGDRSEEQLASCCLQILISGEHHPLSGIFHFPEVSLTSVINQEAWKWPMKMAMAPKDVPVCSQLKLVQAETSRRDAGSSHRNKGSHSPGLGAPWAAGNLRGSLLWPRRGSAWLGADTLRRAEPDPEP